MNPALIDALTEVDRRAKAAGHGGKEAVYAEACARMACSRATLLRNLKQATVREPRKRRSDAGHVALSLPDAQMLSAVLMEGYRANDKRIMTLKEALLRLRKNRPGFACVLDAQTGELLPLSDSACSRALRVYCLHPDQLRAPAPVQQLYSDHPNDVWQIDASISTLFYVPDGGVADMAPGEFYKNKPGNFERIKRQRLTRYVITDHCSGSIFVHYVAGGESTVNMTEAFLAAIGQRPKQQMYGVPYHLMMDPGSAGMGGAFRNLLRRLLVAPVVNQAGNPRAKGQVENAHNLVETSFESGFKLAHVPHIDWINSQAQGWMRWYNSAQEHKHSRHGMTRWDKWREITPAQLRLVDAALARQLLTHEPETPKVERTLTVRFAGRVWNVREVPGVLVGERIAITFNPFATGRAYAVQHDAQGNEQLIEVPEQTVDAHGFAEGAAHIGREYKALPGTRAQANRKLVERIATGAPTDEQAQAARKARALPFGGRIDPYLHHAGLPAAIPLPRRGTALETGAQVAQAAPAVLPLFKAARALADLLGRPLTPGQIKSLQGWRPDGVPEDQLSAIAERLAMRVEFRVVAGGGI